MEFDPHAIIDRFCEHRKTEPRALLATLLQSLAAYHTFGNAIFPDLELPCEDVTSELNGLIQSIKTPSVENGCPPRSLLEVLSMSVAHEYNRSLKFIKANDTDEADADDWMEAQLMSKRANEQNALYLILREAMNHAETFGLAEALGE